MSDLSSKLRSTFAFHGVFDRVVFVSDMDGRVSMTNDAENVTAFLADKYPGHRLVYRDSMGRWDELLHKDGVFLTFAPWRGFKPI